MLRQPPRSTLTVTPFPYPTLFRLLMGETLPGLDHGFVWIDVVDPHDSEITLLQHSFGLHELAIEDSMSDAQPAKLDFYADHVFIVRSEAHTSELQSLMRISYAVFCLKKKKAQHKYNKTISTK